MATNRDAFASLRYFAVCYVICRCSQLPSNASITTLRSQKSSTYMEAYGWTTGWTACSHLSEDVRKHSDACKYPRSVGYAGTQDICCSWSWGIKGFAYNSIKCKCRQMRERIWFARKVRQGVCRNPQYMQLALTGFTNRFRNEHIQSRTSHLKRNFRKQ